MAHGYAARMIVNNEIQISTVSETRRGATVNGIVSLLGRMVFSHWTDREIESVWHNAQGSPLLYEIVPVLIVGVDD